MVRLGRIALAAPGPLPRSPTSVAPPKGTLGNHPRRPHAAMCLRWPADVVRPRSTSFRLHFESCVFIVSSPTASVWVWYRSVRRTSIPGYFMGASHWVEHMLFEGSPRSDKGAIDKAVVEVGGELNAFTDTDFTAIFTTVPREHLHPTDIESDRMTRGPSHRPGSGARAHGHPLRTGGERELAEFARRRRSTPSVFPFHPYRWDALGMMGRYRTGTTPEELRPPSKFYGDPQRRPRDVAGAGSTCGHRRAMSDCRFGRLPASGADVAVGHAEPCGENDGPSAARDDPDAPRWPGGPAPGMTPATPAVNLDTILGGESRLFSAGAGSGSFLGRAPQRAPLSGRS